MIDPFWLALLAKMAASAAIVVVASMIVERSGPFVGALVATLPISAGPAYVFLSLDQDSQFIATSALVSFAVCAATAPFVAIYGRLAPRFGVLVSLGCGLLAWFAIALPASRVDWTFGTALLFNTLAFGACLWLVWPLPPSTASRGFARRWWDVPLRALTVMSVAGSVVLAARLFGPDVAGLLALLPVVLSSFAIVLHPRLGGAVTSVVMLHSLPGMIGFTLGIGALHLTAVPIGTTAALLLCLAVCVAWNLMLFGLRQRRMLST